MSNNIRLSWRNNSTDQNNLSGVAVFTVDDITYDAYGPDIKATPLEMSLPSFKDAHEIFGLLEKAYNLGRFHSNKNIADNLRAMARDLINK